MNLQMYVNSRRIAEYKKFTLMLYYKIRVLIILSFQRKLKLFFEDRYVALAL
jgi:hypothetical protein